MICDRLIKMLVVVSEPGIGIEQGLYVSHLVQGSAAAKEGTLAVGDRILSVSTPASLAVGDRILSVSTPVSLAVGDRILNVSTPVSLAVGNRILSVSTPVSLAVGDRILCKYPCISGCR